MSDFRFVFMADCQIGCYATFSGLTQQDVERYASQGMKVRIVPTTVGVEWDAEQYRTAIRLANRLKPSFVAMGGDMVDDTSQPEQLETLLDITAGLDGIPMRWVPGNHDVAADGVTPTTESLSWYRRTFGPDRYSFQHHDTTFVVVDTTIWHQPEQVADEADQQLAFLEEELANATNSRHRIILAHHPLFLRDADEPDTYWNLPIRWRERLLRLLSDRDVRAWFSGHYHRNAGGFHRDLEVIVSGPVGYPLGDDPSGVRIVEVRGDRIDHHYRPLEETGDNPVEEDNL